MSSVLKYDNNDIRKKATAIIVRAAGKFRIPTYSVNSKQFWISANGEVTDWQMRRIGNFTRVRESEFPAPEGAIRTGSITRYSRFVGHQSKLANFNLHTAEIGALFKNSKLGKNDVFKILVMPDAHVEEHDPYALNAFCKFAQFYKPHGLVNIGDFMEMDSVTHWPAPDARPRRLVPQVKRAREILEEIDKACGKQCIEKWYLIGNHEDWLDQYLVSKIPEALDGLEEIGVDLSFAKLLGLDTMGYRTIPLNEILRIGKHCHFIHGYYTNRHHAAKHLEVFGVNTYYGHTHDVQQASTVSVSGVHEAMSLGCLRDLNAPFLKGKPNNWSHAFGIFEFMSDGMYTRYVPLMIDGKFTYNGRLFDGTKI